jgi:type IV pilus assembly protein PilC
MEHQIKTIAIPSMVKEGAGIVDAFEKTGVFTENALSRFRSGSETGAVREVSLQLANYYEKETSYKLNSVIDLINLFISMFIMIVMIGLTVVSSETAVIKPENPLSG